jgi:hypothetical protein
MAPDPSPSHSFFPDIGDFSIFSGTFVAFYYARIDYPFMAKQMALFQQKNERNRISTEEL